ncbi:DNA-binding transcriptional regulator, LysR family [Alloyangia pacifica]|uniref:DNA-binding transcriptional regulator, LysR family n=2 Tax=Alloyangia pacifica TaxID=311180 RepID=A0A1I6UUY7_9RHOB|nr:DNA-binding transcriptional regulator, LysR family [Alloyangia pacifica]SFT05144.1 DNA-binding transcriptional regulator, LysR family [Alloyangia pacifica]
MQRRLVPDISTLQTFECAARHGNFTRAAEELSLTQSAVSRQIRDLEAQTGLRLFERVRQRVVLSETGERFLPEVRELLARAERMMIGAMAAGQRRQPLRVATLPTFGTRWLIPRLGAFAASAPDVALTIESRGQPFSFDEDNFDLAIHYGQPSWPGAVATFLCSEVVVPVAAPFLAARLQRGQTLEDSPRLHLTTRPKLWQDWFDREGEGARDAYNGIRFDQFSMIISAAVAGMGLALLPSYLIEDEIARGALIPVSDRAMATEYSYYIVQPERKRTSKAAELFQDWLLGQVTRREPGMEKGLSEPAAQDREG